jgi:hypothetical protein
MTRILTTYVLSGALAVLAVAVPSSADAIEIKTPPVTMTHVNVPQAKTPQAKSGAASPLIGQALTTNETIGPSGLNFSPRPNAKPKLNVGTKNSVTVRGVQ